MRIRHTLVTAALGSMLALGAVTAPTFAASPGASASAANEPPTWTPSNAAAWTCGGPAPTSNGPGGVTVTKAIWLRDGPAAGCGNASGYTLQVGTRLGGWCYAYGDSGLKWLYVSTGGAAPYGWIYVGNVNASDVGTITKPCS